MNAAIVATSHQTFARKARTFHWASHLLPAALRTDAAIVYAFCRAVDDTADEADDPFAASAALDRLEAEVRGDAPPRPLVAEFRATAARLDLPLDSALELIEGVRSDLGHVRIRNDAELVRYCYRVASTVGLMMCAVLGVRSREAFPRAVDLGIAMQLTNIARDVNEDAERGRIYLPLDRLARAGVGEDSLLNGTADPRAVANTVAQVLDLADRYYRSADSGMCDIPWRPRQAILVVSRTYRAIGVRLRRHSCDALAGRTIVPQREKVWWSARALATGLMPGMLGITRRPTHDATLHRAIRGLPGTAGNRA